MCGIVGILGNKAVALRLVDALRRLEYRGYDSAGVATLEDGHLTRRRAEGKISQLAARLDAEPLLGHAGIGHTRWATHGAPTEANAHPHATERLALVHNGIIENFRELRKEIEAAGRTLASDTDTEVIAHLITLELQSGMAPADAVKAVLPKLEGAFALAVLFEGDSDLMIAARRGSPLAIGRGKGEVYLGSDAIALAPFTNVIIYLEDGDCAVMSRKKITVYDQNNKVVTRQEVRSVASSLMVDAGNFPHFMLKEIYEQPEVVGHALAAYCDFAQGKIKLPLELLDAVKPANRISITACGTAYYAGVVAKYWLERIAKLSVDIDVASEFRYREQPLSKNDISVVISQSGETADTLASLRYCKKAGQTVVAVVNVETSTIARESDTRLLTRAGPEIGVASTKAFTCQLAVLAALAIGIARARGAISRQEEERLVQELSELPRFLSQTLKLNELIRDVALKIKDTKHAIYLGRGTSYPIALEGALKLKEISYIHAEGYAAGELKHGPIALVDDAMPVIVIAPYDRVFDKTVSNMQEVEARRGRIFLVTDEKGSKAAPLSAGSLGTLVLPQVPEMIAPIVYSLPMQLLAYHTAVAIGTDVDHPRNLAKSVTVE